MLKLGKDLWIYEPESDRSIKISGNMLKQSVMGSDLSYEDFMEETKLVDAYSARISGETELDGRQCWVLDLTAKQSNLAYFKRKLWVDKERYVVLKEFLYAKSGKLLKSITASDFRKTGNRWYPHYILFKDELKEGKGTQYYIDSIQFDIVLPANLFTKGVLRNEALFYNCGGGRASRILCCNFRSQEHARERPCYALGGRRSKRTEAAVLSGSGQCNFTNVLDKDAFLKKLGSYAMYLKPAYYNFDNVSLVSLLAEAGCKHFEREDGKVFPASLRRKMYAKLYSASCSELVWN
jgi:hypothetical protein